MLAVLVVYHWHDASLRLVFFSSATFSSYSPSVALSPRPSRACDASLTRASARRQRRACSTVVTAACNCCAWRNCTGAQFRCARPRFGRKGARFRCARPRFGPASLLFGTMVIDSASLAWIKALCVAVPTPLPLQALGTHWRSLCSPSELVLAYDKYARAVPTGGDGGRWPDMLGGRRRLPHEAKGKLTTQS